MLDNLKKYWFVIIVGLVFVVFIGVYSAGQINGVLKGKKVDGKQVVSSIKDDNYFVDDYFADLQKSVGDGQVYQLFQKAVLRSIATPANVVEESKKNAKAFLDYNAQQGGTAGIEKINATLIAMGYGGKDELNLYYEDMSKYNEIIKAYALANKESVIDPYVTAAKPRLVSHILIKMSDPTKPTEEQQKKLDAVTDRLAKGEAFADVATALSEDEGSAVKGGSIGYTDSSSRLVEPFLKAALETADGQTSAWINTEYGRHLVKVDTTDINKIMESDLDQFIQGLTGNDSKISYKAIWEKAQTLEIKFGSDEIKTRLLNFMQIKGDQ